MRPNVPADTAPRPVRPGHHVALLPMPHLLPTLRHAGNIAFNALVTSHLIAPIRARRSERDDRPKRSVHHDLPRGIGRERAEVPHRAARWDVGDSGHGVGRDTRGDGGFAVDDDTHRIRRRDLVMTGEIHLAAAALQQMESFGGRSAERR